MDEPLYLFGSVSVLRSMFDRDRIPVMYEDSYIWSEYLHLTRNKDAWVYGDLRVDFFPKLEADYNIQWHEDKGYSDSDITGVIPYVKDVIFKEDGLRLDLSGYVYMYNPMTKAGEMCKLGEILLQEQLVLKQSDAWEKFLVFCEKNSGFLFPIGTVLTLTEQGVQLSY